jgi:hypothetical protein
VAAEAGGPLAERLGRPEAYAAELRASAGLPAPGASGRRRTGSWLRETWGAQQAGRIWQVASTHPAGRAVLEFLPELRPAWWVLRGYLAVQTACVALSFLDANLGGLSFPVPRPFGSRVLGLLAVAAAVAASVALGRRGTSRRGLVALGNAGLGLFAVLMLLELGAGEAYDDQYHPGYVTAYTEPAPGLRADGKEISNIFPFDADGKPLQGVYLIDQDGDPVTATRQETPNWRRGCRSTGRATRSPTATRRCSSRSTRPPGSPSPVPPRSSTRRRDRWSRRDPGYPAGGWDGSTTEKWPPVGSTRTAMRPKAVSNGGAPTDPPSSVARWAVSSVSSVAK